MNSAIREIIETIALAGFLFLLLHTSVQNYRVEGPSMFPQLEDKELVLANKAVFLNVDLARAARFLPWLNPVIGEQWFPFHPPEGGDVVVFQNPRDPAGADFVKRVIGEPGDVVEIVQGHVLVNGEKLDEPYLEEFSQDTYTAVTIPSDEYFVMGDNRRRSEDSRHFGTVHRDNIIGKVWLSYWPLDQFGLVKAEAR